MLLQTPKHINNFVRVNSPMKPTYEIKLFVDMIGGFDPVIVLTLFYLIETVDGVVNYSLKSKLTSCQILNSLFVLLQEM